jgi:nitrogen fixation/metabolism regulation signal transduction histidine kinase
VNSLRARLIVGFSLVAVLPLALAMLILGQRIQHTVRAQASARLEATLEILEERIVSDAEQLKFKLEVLARDPELRRLYLVESANPAALNQYLAAQQSLLDLDYLWVTDTTRALVADAASAATAPLRRLAEPMTEGSMTDPDSGGVRLVPTTGHRAALDASAAITYGEARVGLVRGGMVLDSTLLARLTRSSGVELLLHPVGGRLGVSTLGAIPELHPEGDEMPSQLSIRGVSYLTHTLTLHVGRGSNMRLVGLASTAAAEDALAVLRSTALALGLLGLVLAVVLGGVWSHQLSRPVERLADFSERISRGEWDEPLEMESMRELQTLVRALERMRSDLGTYRDKLRAGERQAAYGQMARKVAHEIKNPLTPIAVSVAGLKRAYDQKHPDFAATLDDAVRTVGEEVLRLKTLLQQFSDLGRFPSPRLGRFDMADLLADLRTLYAHEVSARRLAFEWHATPLPLLADRDQLRQALINLIQNGLDATAAIGGHVRVDAIAQGGALWLSVSDDGPGLDGARRAQLFVPGFTTKAHGSGLGLTIVERIVSDHGGSIDVDGAPGEGTTFVVRLALAPEE